MTLALPDVPALPNPGLYELLQAMRRQVIEIGTRVEGLAAGGGSAAAGGARDPKSLVLDFASSFDNYDASADADVYIRAGDYATSRARTTFNKHMEGRGQIIGGTYAAPAKFGHMSVKPATFAVQGETGWFRGDQWFTDGGEWKVIGPLVRTYDLTARYFESNTIPHHQWLDVESGNSGLAGYATGGVTPGNTMTLSGPGSAEWVGKQCQIKNGFGGPALSGTLTVQSVAGNVVTFTSAHAVNAPWTPPSSAPSLSFALRTWAGMRYVRVRARAGGDIYGDLVRVQIEYAPKGSELDHVFNTMTGAQYGGSIDFRPGTSGTYCTGWESQYNALSGDPSDPAGPDVCVRVRVDSCVRDNDKADRGGRSWTGYYLSSTGKRPCDSGYALLGSWRRGLDTVAATLMEGSYLTGNFGAGISVITVKWSSGARPGQQIIIDGGAYVGNVVSVAGNSITITPALNAIYAIGTIVDFPNGGAAVIMKEGQGINWDGQQTQAGRGGDPLGIWGPGWGNQTGDVWSACVTDGGGKFLGLFNGDARYRFYSTGFTSSAKIQSGGSISAAQELATSSSVISGNYQGAVVFGVGSGEYLTFNTVTQKFEFYVNSALVFSTP